MSLPLEGKTIALAEGRQLEDLAQMLEKEGATALRCPMVSILDAPDSAPVLDWLRTLSSGRFDFLILMTGEALRRLMGFADRAGMRDKVLAALSKTKTVTRGPKPVKALRELGLTPALVAESPTTEGVMATLKSQAIRGKAVALTLYGEPNPPLEEFLKSRGAAVHSVMPYVYAPRADGRQVADLIQKMASGKTDAILFTSSSQVDRLYEVAGQENLAAQLQQGLERTRVGAVGPVVAENLRKRGAHVDICPEHGFVMKNLVQQISRALTGQQ
jgi:uroporphyrinogen-III synthase